MSVVSLSNGIEIKYEFLKRDELAETLVFMNGTFNVLEDWEGVASAISNNSSYNIVTFDMRNQGGSTKIKEDFEYADFVEDATLLFDYLELSQFTIITYSSASTIAIDYIINHPNRVKKLIMGAPVINPFGNFKNQLISKASLTLLELGTIKDVIVLSFPLMISGKACEQGKDSFADIQEGFSASFEKENLLPFMRAWDGNAIDLTKIQTVVNSVETHYICGDEDIFNAPVFVNELQEQVPDLKIYRLENSGHAFHMENMPGYIDVLNKIFVK